MSIAKVIEVIAEGKTIEDALESGLKDASKSVRNIKTMYVDGIQAIVDDGKIKKYRVNAKLTFIVND